MVITKKKNKRCELLRVYVRLRVLFYFNTWIYTWEQRLYAIVEHSIKLPFEWVRHRCEMHAFSRTILTKNKIPSLLCIKILNMYCQNCFDFVIGISSGYFYFYQAFKNEKFTTFMSANRSESSNNIVTIIVARNRKTFFS